MGHPSTQSYSYFMRVLVVDDSPAIRRRIVAMVREADVDARVTEASHGEEALLLAKRDPPKLVVLDLALSGDSGLDLVSPLKTSAAAPTVLVLTNHATEHHRRECLAQGADYFFDKSLEFDRVRDVVCELASGSRP
jgi:DNA-binding response OmpR family regulator